MFKMMSKILRTLMSMVTNTTTSTGRSIGTVTRRNVCHSDAPSICAASSTSRLSADKPRADDDHRKARPDPEVRDDHRDVDDRQAEDRLEGRIQ